MPAEVIDIRTGLIDAYRMGLVDELEAWEARRGGRIRRARRSLASVLRALAGWVQP